MWYRENEYCEFHKIKGHSTNRCLKLKNYIQDLIDRGDIELESNEPISKNQQLGIYKDPFPKHDQNQIQTNPIQDRQTNNIYYNKRPEPYDAVIGNIELTNNYVATIKVKSQDYVIMT